MRIGIIRVLRRVHLRPNADNMHRICPISLITGYNIQNRLGISLQTIGNKFESTPWLLKAYAARFRRIRAALIAGRDGLGSGRR